LNFGAYQQSYQHFRRIDDTSNDAHSQSGWGHKPFAGFSGFWPPGWRLGYVIASRAVTDAVRKVHDFLTVGAAAPLQEAAVTALEFPDSYYQDLCKGYTARRARFLEILDNAGLKYIVPMGAYYVMADISEFGRGDDVVFCEWLAREVGVAAVPGSSFFRDKVNNFIRFHFAKKEETLIEAGKRLLRLRPLLAGRL
jgi:aminotransferase